MVFKIKLYCVSGTHMSVLMGESEGIYDKRLLIDFVRWTQTASSSCCAQELGGWASTSLLQIRASYLTLTGTHRMTCRSQTRFTYHISQRKRSRETVCCIECFNPCNNWLFDMLKISTSVVELPSSIWRIREGEERDMHIQTRQVAKKTVFRSKWIVPLNTIGQQ